MTARRINAWVAMVALVAGGGCVPNWGVTWLPDSSGFLYLGRSKVGNRWESGCHHYDISTDRLAKLAPLAGECQQGPLPVGLTANGGFAFAMREDTKDGPRSSALLSVHVYDRDGNERHRSKVETLHSGVDPVQFLRAHQKSFTFPAVCWTPDQERLVIGTGTGNEVLLYDPKAGSFRKTAALKECALWGLWNVAGTARTPEGNAYLALGFEQNFKPVVAVGDGQGAHRLAALAPLLVKQADPEVAARLQAMLIAPHLHRSGWEGDTAEVRWSDSRIRFKPRGPSLQFDQVPVARTADGLIVQQEVTFPGHGATLRVVEVEERKYARLLTRRGLDDEDNYGKYRLEATRPGKKAVERLLDNERLILLNPSPDGNWQAVLLPLAKRILVLDRMGMVRKTLALAE